MPKIIRLNDIKLFSVKYSNTQSCSNLSRIGISLLPFPVIGTNDIGR